MDLAKFNRIFVSNEHIQKIVSCMLNFARSIIESHNHNQTNDWMYNVMQKLPIWLRNWSKSGICKRFPPFGTYVTKSWSKFFVFQYIFADNLIPKNISNIRNSLYIFLICYWKEIIHEAKEDIDLKFYEWNMYFTPEIKQIAWMILDLKKKKK